MGYQTTMYVLCIILCNLCCCLAPCVAKICWFRNMIGVIILVKPVPHLSKQVRLSSAAGSYAGFAGYMTHVWLNALEGIYVQIYSEVVLHWDRKMALGMWCLWGKKQVTVSGEHEHRKPKSVNIFLGFFFLVNYSLGMGFLAMPYSFLHAGYLVAIPTLLVIVFVSWIHASWVLEVMARAQVRWGCFVTFSEIYWDRTFLKIGLHASTQQSPKHSWSASFMGSG